VPIGLTLKVDFRGTGWLGPPHCRHPTGWRLP
jgi:hypothetical protein